MADIKGLRNTVSLMLSEDYKERFIAEYRQLKIRKEGLEVMIENWKKQALEFTPKCPSDVLVRQLVHMKNYMAVLEMRARIEGIDLNAR